MYVCMATTCTQLLECCKKEEVGEVATILRTVANLHRHAHWDVPEFVANALLARIMIDIDMLWCVRVRGDDCVPCDHVDRVHVIAPVHCTGLESWAWCSLRCHTSSMTPRWCSGTSWRLRWTKILRCVLTVDCLAVCPCVWTCSG